MTTVVPLAEAADESIFGAKAVGLGEAIRFDLPVPPGVALSGPTVAAVASGDQQAIAEVTEAIGALGVPLAVRSSCVDEDGANASFAGQHLTVLNVPSPHDVGEAVREIWWSANSDSAITYRQRVGLFSQPNVGVVVQTLLDPDVAGVMFTQNPINGADERLIEASWGLGEAVVAGRVIPDQFRIDRTGAVLGRVAGLKRIAIRGLPGGGTVDEEVAPDRVHQLCLDDEQLTRLTALADRCEQIYGPARDIEWAFAGGQLYLLQCRAVTWVSSRGSRVVADDAVETSDVVERISLFADLEPDELDEVARLFKLRRFAPGETVAKEGAGGATLFVIESGEAVVSIRGMERRVLGPGDYFGEIALIDEGARSATVTAATELVCSGITLWDFRPLVQHNGTIAWKLLQSLARRLREAQDELAAHDASGGPTATS
jgi:pyruvate,water dikinase